MIKAGILDEECHLAWAVLFLAVKQTQLVIVKPLSEAKH